MNSNDEKLFDELGAAGHAHAATQLAAKPQYIAPYIAYLFRKFNESALAVSAAAAVVAAAATTTGGADAAPRGTKSNNSRVVADILIACTWIVFGGDPVESLTRLLEAGQLPSTACGQLWQHSCTTQTGKKRKAKFPFVQISQFFFFYLLCQQRWRTNVTRVKSTCRLRFVLHVSKLATILVMIVSDLIVETICNST